MNTDYLNICPAPLREAVLALGEQELSRLQELRLAAASRCGIWPDAGSGLCPAVLGVIR